MARCQRGRAVDMATTRQTAAPEAPGGAALWAHTTTTSSAYQRDDPYLAAEVDGLVHALEAQSPQSTQELVLATGARRWGTGRFHRTLRSGLAAGRIRRVGCDRYAAGRTDRLCKWGRDQPSSTAPVDSDTVVLSPRLAAKNEVRSAPHSSARTPSMTASSWLSRGSTQRL